MTNKSLLVQKQNIFKTQIQEIPLPELQEGEILFKIKQYALTSNNITYAVSGFSLKYWNFFPINETWGLVPVWGFAEVAASRCQEIAIKEQYFGYFPMSQYLIVQPNKIRPTGFSDGTVHRQGLATVYNNYEKIDDNPAYPERLKDYIPIVRPLFTTSFLLYYFLKEENFFESEQIILTSSSSKTGMALAFMLKQKQEKDGKKIIGLTSSSNVDFVKSTEYYDEVIAYSNLDQLTKRSSTIIDFAGNTELLHKLSNFLDEHLKYISLIGLTDWQAYKGFKELPKAKFFFAPNYVSQRFKEWGMEKTLQLIAKALYVFIQDSRKVLKLEYVTDFKELESLFVEMVKGNVNPKKAYMVSL